MCPAEAGTWSGWQEYIGQASQASQWNWNGDGSGGSTGGQGNGGGKKAANEGRFPDHLKDPKNGTP